MSPHAAHLLETSIDSYEKLDLVMALHAAPQQTLSVEELAGQLRFGRSALRGLVERLVGARLCALRDDQVTLAPGGEDRRAIDELAGLFVRDRAAIASVLSTSAVQRIRAMARSFAEKNKP